MNASTKHFLRWLSALFVLSSILRFQPPAQAATNIVLAGEDLQGRINAAASGDVMVVQGGTYAGDITINKPLVFVRSGTAELQLLGPVTITTPGIVSFNQCGFSDRVFVAGGTQLSITEGKVTGLFGVTDASCNLRQSLFQQGIFLTNASMVMLRSTNQTTLNAYSPTNSTPSLFVSQSESGSLEATGYRVHCGYSRLGKVSLARSIGVFVGNRMTSGGFGPTVECSQGELTLRNNYILNGAAMNRPGDVYAEVFHVILADSMAVIENNTLFATRTYTIPPHPQSGGILFQGNASKVEITGNIIRLNEAPTAAIRRVGNGQFNIAYNFLSSSVDNVTAYATSAAEPRVNPDGSIPIDSPCRNAGPPDPLYNDRDGTRNDAGFTGGPLYNPAFATTDLPMVFWLDTKPRRVLKGAQNTIRIEAAGAAGF